MKIIVDELEGAFYMDVLFTEDDILKLKMKEMVESYTSIGRVGFYIGSRVVRDGYYEERLFWEEEN